MRRIRTSAARRRLWRDESGSSSVEFAIVGSLLIGLCLIILQIGWALQVRNEMSMAADRAVRFVMLTPTASDAQFKAEVESALKEYDPKKLKVTPGETKVGTATFRTIKVQYDFSLLAPGFSMNLVELEVSRRTPKI